jgi:hypothetical protein
MPLYAFLYRLAGAAPFAKPDPVVAVARLVKPAPRLIIS